ncbi:MAG: phosphohydrolase [Bacteroidetes bacterium QS_8_64_10]|jgi:(p)ppGpp synthase/HD superfamily hydrolase|nr:MAG: phosphohydrolase [Bacteroidetes bacterium QS_8_64_10]
MNPFSPLVEHAVELAAQWHDGTYRKGGWRDPAFERPEGATAAPRVPVMTHLTAVALAVQRAGFEDEVVAAAFLHDTLEDENRHDQRLRSGRLRDAVGEDVTGLVQIVSEKKLDDEGRRRPWRVRKEEYVANLGREPAGAVAISLADKLHNLWTINQSLERDLPVFSGGENHAGLSAGPEQQRWFHRAVMRAARRPDDERLVGLRDRLSAEIERFEDLTT